MLNKIFRAAIICLLFVLSANIVSAQLVANAGRDTTICAGDSVVLGGNPTASGGNPGYTYAWSPVAGLSSATVANPVAIPAITTTYTVTVTDVASNTAVSSITVTVNPVPTSTFSVTSPVCVGQAATITYSGNAPATPAYSWNFVDGTNIVDLGGVQGPFHAQWPSAGVRYLTLSILQNGCRSATDSVMITVNAGWHFDSLTTVSARCYGDSNGSICLHATDGNPPYTFQWSNFGASGCQTVTAGTYSVTALDSYGCSVSASGTVTQPIPIQDSVVSVGVSCHGTNDGSACVYVLGGTPAYTHNWSTGETLQCISGLAAGQYFVVVSDMNGCSATDSVIVAVSGILTDSLVTTNVVCNGDSSGAICSYALNGTGPYYYVWSNGETTQCMSNLIAGVWSTTVQDSHGCMATATATVTQPPALTVTDSVTNVACFGAANGSICVAASGGNTPYNFSWSNNGTLSCITVTEGAYTCTVTDGNACTATVSAVITQPAAPVTVQAFTPDTNALPDSVGLVISGGTTPYSVNWNDGQFNNNLPDSVAMHVYVTGGVYTDTVTDGNGCVATYIFDAGCSDQCVWPGDANYDGIVDNNDLLPIGVAYDSTGYTRSHPTINFIPQYCQSWGDTLTGGIDYKHVDCNGDGIINADDTDAVMLNYSFTHVRGSGGQEWRDDAPALYIKTSPDTLADGEILTSTLSLGNISMPVANVYALAFTYNFDPMVVDTTGVSISFGNSWLFGAGDHISISKNFYGPGQIQAAVTRIDHVNRSGYGPIATVSMKITTGNINGKNLQYYLMNNYISNLIVIENTGRALVVNPGYDSAVVAYTPTGIHAVENANGHIEIFPNPASDQLNIVSMGSEIKNISIVDLTGKQVINQNMQAGNYAVIDISALSAGVYMVKLSTANEEYHSRFVKVSGK